MKIAAAQIRSMAGNIEINIKHHTEVARVAIAHQVDVVVFPELSLTGYEPSIAGALAITADHSSLDPIAEAAASLDLVLSVGLPLRSKRGIHIGIIFFLPDGNRQIYTKAHLHADEQTIFTKGTDQQDLMWCGMRLAPSICYELSIEDHIKSAGDRRANVYLSSVAKHQQGVESAVDILSASAKTYGMQVIMANAVGHNDDFTSAGQSVVLNRDGNILAQMDAEHEGLLVYDTKTQAVQIVYM